MFRIFRKARVRKPTQQDLARLEAMRYGINTGTQGRVVGRYGRSASGTVVSVGPRGRKVTSRPIGSPPSSRPNSSGRTAPGQTTGVEVPRSYKIDTPHNSVAEAAKAAEGAKAAGGANASNAESKARAAGAAAGPSFWNFAKEDWNALGAGWRGFWRPPQGSSRWDAIRSFVGSDDIRAKYAHLPKEKQDWAVLSAQIRRGAMLGAAGLWGLSQVRDLADRAFNPNRHFMMDPTNRRVDLPIVPFI